MYIIEILTPIGIINLSFEQEMKDKNGEVKKFGVPIVFKSEEKALKYLKTNLKGQNIYAYNIKHFKSFNDSDKE